MEPLLLYVLDLSPAADPATGWTRRDPRTAMLTASDLGATRGDGVFETAVVVDGVPQALDAHLDRFARSAALMDLPVPRREHWRAAVTAMASELSDPDRRRAIKFVMTRGDEAGDGTPSGWLLGFAPGAGPAASVRDSGVAVVLLDRGYRHDVAQTSPWLLQGAKSLSYAVNMAALREARRRGADEVVFTSIDGFVLEGPSSTVIARIDGQYVTPPPEFGILEGTTQGDAFDALRGAAARVATRPVRVDELERADAVWLCSSTRGAVPVRSIDGAARTIDHERTAFMNAHLDARKA